MHELGYRAIQVLFVAVLVVVEIQFHLFSRSINVLVYGTDTDRLHWLLGFGLALAVGWAARRAL